MAFVSEGCLSEQVPIIGCLPDLDGEFGGIWVTGRIRKAGYECGFGRGTKPAGLQANQGIGVFACSAGFFRSAGEAGLGLSGRHLHEFRRSPDSSIAVAAA